MGITVINHTKPRSIPYTFIPTPLFRDEYEKERYWAEERKKWIDGIPGLTGQHYFHLSQGWVQRGVGGEIFRPGFRDYPDQLIFETIKEAAKLEYDAGIIKRRECGLTCICAGTLPSYYMLTQPGSNTIMTSCDKARIFLMFIEKTAIFYDNLHKHIQPAQSKRNERKESVYLSATVLTKGEDGETRKSDSRIYCAETVKNPKAFSTTRAAYGFFDEFALHTNRDALLRSSKACFREGPRRPGRLVWGGTVEKGISVATLQALRKIVGNAKESKTLICFVEAWMGMYMEGGFCNKKKGVEFIMKERDRLWKAGDEETYWADVKDYPLTLDEALESSATGVFPPDISKKISDQRKIVISNPPPIMRHKIIQYPDEKLKAEPDPTKGDFHILSHPEPGVTYIGGIDPIPYNDARLDDGSEHFLAIKDYDHDVYVACYFERNLDADVVVENSILLQDYYNSAPAMLERNHGGATFLSYKNHGRVELLAKRPNAIGIKFTDKRVSRGWFKGDKTSAKGNEFLIKLLKHHTDNIFWIRLIDELERYLNPDYNNDFLDAVISCEVLDANMRRLGIKGLKPKQSKQIPQIVRDPQTGKTKTVMTTIYV